MRTPARGSAGSFCTALGAALFFLPLSALAQAAAPESPGSAAAVNMDQYIVTGSYLPMSSAAPAIPVMSLDPWEIEAGGIDDNLLDLLEKTDPMFSGSANVGLSNGNIGATSTNGGSEAAIHNLPTLVLINGRRIATDPVGAVGGNTFVDLNLIPVSAIEKVEILPIGASAIYGSDAIGGVINVRLKRDFNGFEIGSRYGFASDLTAGQWATRSAHLTGGASDGRTSVMVSAEWTKSDPLYQFQVSPSRYTIGTATYPGVILVGANFYILNSGLTAPPSSQPTSIANLVASGIYTGPYTSPQVISRFNLSGRPTTLIGDQRRSLMANLSQQWSEALKLSLFYISSQTDTFSQLNGQPINERVPAGAPYNPVNATISARDRFVDYPRTYLNDTPTVAAAASLEGTLGGSWTWEAGGGYSEGEQHFTNHNLVSNSALLDAEASFALNPFATDITGEQAAALGVFGTAFGVYRSSLFTYDAVARGTLFHWYAGDAQAALGGQFRRDGVGASADINSQPNTFNWNTGTEITPLTVSRNSWAEFAQLDIPIAGPSNAIPGVYSLTGEAAARREEFGGMPERPVVPLASLRWQPLDDHLSIRASYGRSFLVPSLFELYGPTSFGTTASLTNFPVAGGSPVANAGQANTEVLPNPSLKPTIGESLSLGLVTSPRGLRGLTVTADYFKIRESDVVGGPFLEPILADVEVKGPASVYTRPALVSGHLLPHGQVTLNDYGDQADAVPITAPGQVAGDTANVFVVAANSNDPGTVTEGCDAALDYAVSTPSGRIEINERATVNLHTWVRDVDGTTTQAAGFATFQAGTIPRWRLRQSAAWTLRGLTATLGTTFIPDLWDLSDGEHINYYWSWDASLGYRFLGAEPGWWSRLRGLSVRMGCENLFNRQPSLDRGVFSQDNTDISTYDPRGRIVYTEATVKY
jgi:iron complex outermembrane receptor protein